MGQTNDFPLLPLVPLLTALRVGSSMVLKITLLSTVAYRGKFDESALNDVGIRDKNFHPSGATIRGLLLHTHTHAHAKTETIIFDGRVVVFGTGTCAAEYYKR